MSKTTRAFPARRSRVRVCRSVSRGRASRSARKSVRKVSAASRLTLARKRERAEREGSFSRSNRAMKGCAKGRPLVKLLQGAFATDGVAEEHGEKVDHLVVPKAAASKAHLRGDGRKDALFPKMLDDEHDFPPPTGRRGDGFRTGLTHT